jgi:alpha-amylase
MPGTFRGTRFAAIGLLGLSGALIAILASTACSPRNPLRTTTATVTPTPQGAATEIATPLQPTPSPMPRANPLAWVQDSTFYLVNVGSFADSNQDGVGDLDGLKDRLDYLNDGDPATTKDLGIGVLCLLPIFSAESMHGFDTLDHLAIRPEFGTVDDFRELLNQCHRRGMRVVLEYVMGYVSGQQPFFQHAYNHLPSVYSDWFLWLDYAQTRYRSFAGVPNLPLLNSGSEGVQEYAIRVARSWIDPNHDGDYSDGVDGYLCDLAEGLSPAFWQSIHAQCRTLRPDFLLLGQVPANALDIAAFWEDEFSAALDTPMYTQLAGQEADRSLGVLSGIGLPDLVDGALAQRSSLYPGDAISINYLNKSDTDRMMSLLRADLLRARLASTLLLTLPGAPMVYYGEEIGMSGLRGESEPFGSEHCREPMDWYASETGPGMPTWFRPPDRNNRPNDGISVEEETNDPASLLSHCRQLIHLRATFGALRSGTYERVKLTQGGPYVLAYLRQDAAARLLVVLNFDVKEAEVALDLTASTLPGTDWRVSDLLRNQGLRPLSGASSTLRLDPQEGLVLELTRP